MHAPPVAQLGQTCHSYSAFWLEEGDLFFSDLWLAAEPPSGVGIGRGDMSTRVGKTVWVRDPALADEAVFSKGKVISEDPQQVCVRRASAALCIALIARADAAACSCL